MWSDLHFLRPLVLWLLPLVPVCFWLLRRLGAADGWRTLLAPHLYQRLHTLTSSQAPGRHMLLPALLLIGILAAAGPSWQKLPQPAFQLKRATVLVVDMSMSMRATDVKPNRVTQARFKALDFARAQSEGEMALLAFAGDAYVISPLTPDHNNIALLLPDLKPEIMPAQGSDFAAALALADNILQQAGYVKGDIVFFTDGFDSRQYTALKDSVGKLRHRVSVLAFGSVEGAPIVLESGELLKDSRGAIVLPKVPLEQLKDLALSTGGVYAHSSFNDDDVQALLAMPALSLSDDATPSQMQGDQWQDGGIYLVYLLLFPALWWLRRRELLALPLLMLICPQPAPAADLSWQDLWQSRNQQAKQAYETGDYERARQTFTDPLWQGNAAYKAGDYAGAAQHFAANPGAESQFNLGNSLAMQQQFQPALEAYQRAQQQNPALPGLAQNVELIKKMLEQQKQQQQQSGDSQQSDEKQQDQEQQDAQQSKDSQQSQQSGDSQDQQSQDGTENTAEQQPEAAEQPAEERKQQQVQPGEEQAKPDEQPQQQAVKEAWPNATPEQSQQLENLLRKVQDDPSLLLKNKMLLEYQKRQQQAVPRGVQQEW